MNPHKFLTSYLKADQLKGREMTCTICDCRAEQVGRGEDQSEKLVVYFQEIDQGLVLNKSNLSYLIGALGDETEMWIGKRVTVYHDPNVMFAGRRVGGLRVKAES